MWAPDPACCPYLNVLINYTAIEQGSWFSFSLAKTNIVTAKHRYTWCQLEQEQSFAILKILSNKDIITAEGDWIKYIDSTQ